jgi:exodeoxyribonuclease V alpha subunit
MTAAGDGVPRRHSGAEPAATDDGAAERGARPARPGLAADAFDARRATRARGLLREFNEAGVLAPADVHVARRLAELAADEDEWVALAAALAVRGPRLGHVYVDLETIHRTATVDAEEPVDLTTLPWPAPDAWLERMHASPLVAVGEDGAGADRPLRLIGSSLYLDRYWREERRLAADLRGLRDRPPADVRDDVLADGLTRLFGAETDNRQRRAAEAAVRRRFAVVAGGPGTGKTTTVARIVALLNEQAAESGSAEPLVALAAPTGKAAARLVESVHEEAAGLDVTPEIRERLLSLDASTLHRLLGWRPGTHSRFRHDRSNRLPHDVVIVDETSMVPLSQMARLVEAIRADARLVLVGDPGQLTSIEAGAVLGDIVASSDDGIVVLNEVFRYGRGIDRVAEAIRSGDADAAIEALSDVTWIPVDAADADDALAPVHDAAVSSVQAVLQAASAGAGREAIEALGAFRILCAHRRGDHGVTAWTSRIETWLAAEIPAFGAEGDWYVGRPLLVTENDYALRLYNGDTGVVIASGPSRATAAFERGGEIVEFSPSRLAAVDTVYAMTVHKSQGSQFDTAAVLLPDPTSPILTRELLYTAVTRARRELILVGTEDSIRAAVSRPVARASGLRWRLSND